MKTKTVLAVASQGGHFIQLERITNSLSSCKFVFVTTNKHLKDRKNSVFFSVAESNFKERWYMLIVTFIQLIIIFYKSKPDVIISTGAAPGFLAIILGKLARKKTLWIDSIANANELSKSGRVAKYNATVCLTQWEHLADGKKIFYKGRVL